MDFAGRIAWILGKIKERERLNNSQLGQILGLNKNTVQIYSKGKGDFKGIALAVISRRFGVSGEWLLSGCGEPFPDTYQKYPEVCGPAGSVSAVHESTPPYGALVAEQKINIEEAMGKAYKILSSGTAAAAVLYLGIQEIAAALASRTEVGELKAQVLELRGQVDRLTAAPTTITEPAAGSDKKAM